MLPAHSLLPSERSQGETGGVFQACTLRQRTISLIRRPYQDRRPPSRTHASSWRAYLKLNRRQDIVQASTLLVSEPSESNAWPTSADGKSQQPSDMYPSSKRTATRLDRRRPLKTHASTLKIPNKQYGSSTCASSHRKFAKLARCVLQDAVRQAFS